MARDLPAWFGKLPALGDFASRRMDPAFLELWDNWLAQGLQGLRDNNPDGWLDAYLVSPTWRFLLMPGCLPDKLGAISEQAWAGVLMPSVDRVGRYFPFTLLRPLTGAPRSLTALQTLWQDLARLDDLAAYALQDDWGLDRLEAELAALPSPSAGVQSPPSPPLSAELQLMPGQLLKLSRGLDGAGQLAAEALQLWGEQARGRSYWCAGVAQTCPEMMVCRGLPESAMALLSASL